jgi:hypothetical protein
VPTVHTRDGAINTHDLALLQNAILGLAPLPNPYAAPVLTEPVASTKGNRITLTGVARPNRTLVVEGGALRVESRSDSNGLFSVTVTRQSNRLNQLFLTASNG